MKIIEDTHSMRGIILLGLFVISAMVSAQEIEVLETIVEDSKGKAVQVNNEWHALVDGTQVMFNITFTSGDLDVTKAWVNYEGLVAGSEDLNIDAPTSIGPINLLESTEGEGRTVTFKVNYEYQTPREGGGYDTHTGGLPVVESKIIHLYSLPNASTDVPAKLYADADYKVTFQTKGGYTSGWKTKVDDEEAKDGSVAVLKKPEEGLPVRKSQTVVVSNYAPDGVTIWSEFNPYVFSIYFYKTPTCISDASNPKETNFYKNTGEETWKVIPDGGNPDGWHYTWSGGSKMSEDKAEYKPFVADVTNSLLSQMLKVHVVNVIDEEVLYDKTIDVATINVFSEITESMALVSGAKDSKSYSGEEVTFETVWASLSDYPGKWNFQWYEGETEVSEQETSILKIIPSESTSYTIKAVYNYNGSEWASFSETYSASVFERPTVKTTEAVNLVKFNNQNVATHIEGATPKTADGNELPSIIADYDNKHVTGVDYEMIVGDKITLGLDKKGGADDWEYSISIGENKSENASLTFVPTDAGEYTMSAKVSNGATLQNPYFAELTRKIKVYFNPDATIPQPKDINLYGTQSYTIKDDISGRGGHVEGWKVPDWGGNDEKTITTDDVDVKKNLDVSYTAVYTCSGYQRCSVPKPVNVTVWPQPSVSAFSVKLQDKDINKVKGITYYDSKEPCSENIDCFSGDKLIVAFEVEGGYADAETGNWTYQIMRNDLLWKEGGITVSSMDTKVEGGATEEIEFPNGSDESMTYQYIFVFKNRVTEGVEHGSDTEFESEAYKLRVVAWRTPTVSEMLTDSTGISWSASSATSRVQVYAGQYEANKVKFNIKKQNGYAEGWSYMWELNNESQSANLETWTYVPQVNAAYEDKTVTVDIVNCIGDNNGMSPVKKTYYMRVWHPVDFPSSFTIKDDNQDRYLTGGYLAVRENNTLRFSVGEMNYGYCPDGDKSGYRYIWTEGVSGNQTREWTTQATGDFALKDQFCSVEKTMGLRLESYGPYGHCWDVSQGAQTYSIYQRPTTPSSIVRKGNGKTGTLICTTNISDADLQEHDYYLVFGYTDDSGVDHDFASQQQKGPGLIRWSTPYESQEQMSNAYVYALWKSDNVEITSGKCMLSNIDELYDTSTYNGGTRLALGGDGITAIKELAEEDGKLEGVINVYNMNGVRVGSVLSGLKPGLYVVEYANGVTKKMIVK